MGRRKRRSRRDKQKSERGKDARERKRGLARTHAKSTESRMHGGTWLDMASILEYALARKLRRSFVRLSVAAVQRRRSYAYVPSRKRSGGPRPTRRADRRDRTRCTERTRAQEDTRVKRSSAAEERRVRVGARVLSRLFRPKIVATVGIERARGKERT